MARGLEKPGKLFAVRFPFAATIMHAECRFQGRNEALFSSAVRGSVPASCGTLAGGAGLDVPRGFPPIAVASKDWSIARLQRIRTRFSAT